MDQVTSVRAILYRLKVFYDQMTYTVLVYQRITISYDEQRTSKYQDEA